MSRFEAKSPQNLQQHGRNPTCSWWYQSARSALQAMATQEANRAASNRMPPIWAIAAIVLLGWNEFFAALRNPLWLVFGLIIFLFGKVPMCPAPFYCYRISRSSCDPLISSRTAGCRSRIAYTCVLAATAVSHYSRVKPLFATKLEQAGPAGAYRILGYAVQKCAKSRNHEIEINFALAQTVWQDLEVEAEMQRGLLPGLVVLSSKFLPTLRSATARTITSAAQARAHASLTSEIGAGSLRTEIDAARHECMSEVESPLGGLSALRRAGWHTCQKSCAVHLIWDLCSHTYILSNTFVQLKPL